MNAFNLCRDAVFRIAINIDNVAAVICKDSLN